jgi:rubrerythrin
MIERKFAALPRYIEYRCKACGKIFSVITLPEKCPHCEAILKEKGYHCTMDEVQTNRA